MKKRSLLNIFALLFCLTLSGIAGDNFIYIGQEEGKNIRMELVLNNVEALSENITPKVNDITLTVNDVALYLDTKNEHYPLSDEFIEKYQQSSGGYIDNAKKAGIKVDKQKHEPNQKWHFFESWLKPSYNEGMLPEASAKTRIYNNLKCPELLLWIFEATEVDPNKVREAKIVAEQGKVAGTNVATIAKEMRGIVPWEDIEKTVINYMETNS